MYQKIAAVLLHTFFFFFFFFVNFQDTSKIRDVDDANRRDKLFQAQTDKNVSRPP